MVGRAAAAGVLVLAMGCGGRGADPASGRMAAGDVALAFDAGSSVVLSDAPNYRGGWVMVPVGTRLRVIDDPEDRDSPARLVRAMVIEGEHEGRSGYLFRERLRPAIR